MSQTIRVTIPQVLSNKISVIKAIRSLTGLGLKEAKDVSEQPSIEHSLPLIVLTTSHTYTEQCHILAENGVVVGPAIRVILNDLRVIASKALAINEDELANEILQLVLAEKLRRNNNE